MAIICTTSLLPARADFCTTGAAFGRIDNIYWTRVGDGLTDWTLSAEWDTRLDNTTAAPSSGLYPIRSLNVIGELVEPEQESQELSLDRTAYSPPDFTINFTVDDMGDVNYALCTDLVTNNGGIFAAWYAAGGYMHGSTAGQTMTMNMVPVIPLAKTELQTFAGTLTWTGGVPGRIVNPL